MFELTNEQRKCFGLLPVESHWALQEVKASPYDNFQTYAYLDGNVIRKCILCGRDRFAEYELCEQLSEDGALRKRAVRHRKFPGRVSGQPADLWQSGGRNGGLRRQTEGRLLGRCDPAGDPGRGVLSLINRRLFSIIS